MFKKFFLSEIGHLWDYVEKYFRVGQTTDYNMAHAHCIQDSLSYKTLPKYVILTALPPQQWLCERVPMLLYTNEYIACPVCSKIRKEKENTLWGRTWKYKAKYGGE